MIATAMSANLLGARGRAVTVEVHVSDGLPSFTMVGLPDEACREARDRVRAAILSSGITWPTNRRVTVNLAPSGERKGGVGLDVAIAVALLCAIGDAPAGPVAELGFVGELGLDGSIRRVPGVAPMVAALPRTLRPVVAPAAGREAAVATEQRVHPVDTLVHLVACLKGAAPWPEHTEDGPLEPDAPLADLADVRGQLVARRALEIAAAGNHHLLMVGPPGAGKTMLATRLPSLLPALDAESSLEATMVHSAAGVALPPGGLVRSPPFRAPHHTSSTVSLVGGGTHALRPGEISLAHGGVLFLDELGEFAPSVLDALRQPLEEGIIRVARARASVVLPARVLLVGATNPCPCGGGPPGSCECDEGTRLRYLRRLSGPLLDRFDVRVALGRPEVDELIGTEAGEPSAVAAKRVHAARRAAMLRAGVLNADIPGDRLDELAPISPSGRAILRDELERGRLTGRGYHRVRRVARSIADLAGSPCVDAHHVAEALVLRVPLGRAGSARAA